MTELLAAHGIVAICLIVTLEEANVPLPIPGDLLLLYAGAMTASNPGRFAWWLLLLTVIPSLGAFVLYELVRRGGRPLVERYGRYLALGPRELAGSEALLRRFGWGGIAVGRSVPLLRHAVTIACGVLDVAPRSFLAGQMVGGLVNTLLLMLLGALVGPALIESFHLPRQAVRLSELLLVAGGLPLGLWWLWRLVRGQGQGQGDGQPQAWSLLLVSLAGAAALSATWAALAVGAGLLGQQPPDPLAGLTVRLVADGVHPGLARALLHAGALVVGAGLGLLTLARRAAWAGKGAGPARTAMVLGALAVGAQALLLTLLGAWQPGSAASLWLGLALSSLAFAVTGACGEQLAAAVAAGSRPWPRAQR